MLHSEASPVTHPPARHKFMTSTKSVNTLSKVKDPEISRAAAFICNLQTCSLGHIVLINSDVFRAWFTAECHSAQSPLSPGSDTERDAQPFHSPGLLACCGWRWNALRFVEPGLGWRGSQHCFVWYPALNTCYCCSVLLHGFGIHTLGVNLIRTVRINIDNILTRHCTLNWDWVVIYVNKDVLLNKSKV